MARRSAVKLAPRPFSQLSTASSPRRTSLGAIEARQESLANWGLSFRVRVASRRAGRCGSASTQPLRRTGSRSPFARAPLKISFHFRRPLAALPNRCCSCSFAARSFSSPAQLSFRFCGQQLGACVFGLRPVRQRTASPARRRLCFDSRSCSWPCATPVVHHAARASDAHRAWAAGHEQHYRRAAEWKCTLRLSQGAKTLLNCHLPRLPLLASNRSASTVQDRPATRLLLPTSRKPKLHKYLCQATLCEAGPTHHSWSCLPGVRSRISGPRKLIEILYAVYALHSRMRFGDVRSVEVIPGLPPSKRRPRASCGPARRRSQTMGRRCGM